MPSRAEILKRIFEKGLESFSKKDLAKLFEAAKELPEGLLLKVPGTKDIFAVSHHSEEPAKLKELFEKGFDPTLKRGKISSLPGLWWSPFKLSKYEPVTREEEKTVSGILRPGAEVINSWEALHANPPTHDFYSGPRGGQLSQLKPRNVLAKYKDLYRILAIAGLLSTSIKE